MNRLLEELDSLNIKPVRNPRREMSKAERKMERRLKTLCEKAIRGRRVSKHVCKVMDKSGDISIGLFLEGEQAMMVARQLEKRFGDHRELEFAKAMRTDNGAKLVLKVKEDKNDHNC